jgi:multicomponent Na+:H+ antiporter subunit A
LALAVLIILLAAVAAPALNRLVGDRVGWLLALAPGALFVYFATFIPGMVEGGIRLEEIPWVPGLDVAFAFRLDGLSLLFALLVTGLGALIVLYAGDYLKGDPLRGRFLLFLLLFMAAMLGLVLADNLILLFVFWELTSFSSYLLIGYKHQYEESRKSALQALLVTGTGGLVLLAGLIVLGIAAGDTFSLSAILEQGDVVRDHPLYLLAFVLVAIGCFAKSAQTPLHFWLPNAMAAPTPVSAYLHSATMVKAGVYLLARLSPALGGTDAWVWTLTIVGTVTMLTGSILALRHTDLKKVLAYSTVTALGTLVLMLGLSVESAVIAGVVFLFVHALYKGTLFLVAGSVDHESGTRDVLELQGLRKAMPWTFGSALLAGLSMAGIIGFFGFIAKEMAYEVFLDLEGIGWLLAVLAVFANALTVVAAGIVVLRPFLGQPNAAASRAHEAPWAMRLGPIVLSVMGVLAGVLPAVFGMPLVGPAADAIYGEPLSFYIVVWHGFNLALLLSVITLALGIAIFLAWDHVRAGLTRLDPIFAWGPEAAYNTSLKGMLDIAYWQTKVIQNGNLRYYILVTVLVAVGLTGTTFLLQGVGVALVWPDASPQAWMVVTLILVGGLIAAKTRSRLLAAGGLGVTGFGVALLYILLGAPDLAMTQFLVETLTVVVILLVMQRLPSRVGSPTSPVTRLRDVVVAGASGMLVTVLLLAVLRQPFDTALAEFFVAESVPGGFGRNIVNVILVDFRALDTLGEIAVLGIAALGAFALMWRGTARRTLATRASDAPRSAEHGAVPSAPRAETGAEQPAGEFPIRRS